MSRKRIQSIIGPSESSDQKYEEQTFLRSLVERASSLHVSQIRPIAGGEAILAELTAVRVSSEVPDSERISQAVAGRVGHGRSWSLLRT